MKKGKSLLALTLAMSMLASLTACGSKNSTTSDNAKAATSTEITMAFICFGPTPKDMTLVQNEINKISLKKINTTVKLMPINAGAYGQQINLMLSGGEKLDLFQTGNLPGLFDYSGEVNKGQLVVLDDLISKSGSDIKSSLGDFLTASKVGGKTYGIPTIRDLASNSGLIIKKDVLAKYGIDVKSIKTLDDAEAALKTIKAGDKNAYPFGTDVGTTFVGSLLNQDVLGDKIGVLPDYNTLKVVNYYETPGYAEMVNTARKWYTEGLIIQDVATNKDSATSMVKSNKIVSYFSQLKPGMDNQVSKGAGVDVVSAPLTNVTTTTQNVTNFMFAIPSASVVSDSAFKFLNLMYADKDIVNLFDWGIEGKHYAKVAGADDLIDYPAGVTAQTTGYGLNEGFAFGNQFLSHIWKGDSPTLYKDLDAFNKGATKSKALGFLFDTTSVKTEYASISGVVSEYQTSLENGAVDPAKYLPEFISKLKAAGIDKVIAEKQAQLDKWVSSNK